MSGSSRASYDDARASYGGWVAGALVILAVCLAGAAFWFMHHP